MDELKVSITARFVGLGVDDNLGVLDLVSFVGEELVEVEVVEVLLRKVANVETRHLVHSLFALQLTLLASTLSVGSVSAKVKVRQLVNEEILGVLRETTGVHALHLGADLRCNHSWHHGELLGGESALHHHAWVVYGLALHLRSNYRFGEDLLFNIFNNINL